MLISRKCLERMILESEKKIKTEHTQSAGVIIFDDDCVLILRAGDTWSFPKGGVEQGEDLLDAAIRETWEETGFVSNRDYMLTGEITPSITYESLYRVSPEVSKTVIKTCTFFVAERMGDRDPILKVNPDLGYPEHEEWMWVDIDKFADPESEDVPKMTKKISPILSMIYNRSFDTYDQ